MQESTSEDREGRERNSNNNKVNNRTIKSNQKAKRPSDALLHLI